MKLKFKDTSNIKFQATTKPVSTIPHSSIQSSVHLSNQSIVPSSKININNKKRPLKTNSQNLAFKGFFYKDVLDASKQLRVFNRAEVLSQAETHLGSNIKRLFDHLIPLEKGTSEEAKSVSKYASKLVTLHEDGTVTFRKKSIPRLIIDGIAYPFTILPADILNGAVSGLKKRGPLKEWATKQYDSQFFKNIRLRSKIDAQVNSLRGMFEVADELKGATQKEASSKYFKTFAKMFDEKTGNYDTKHERSLARIVSGGTSAIFLANDAYNLSRMCNDDSKEASAEKKARFRQEVSRVGLQAYITLITMGAIQKAINSNKFAVMANVGLTALFTEAVSRLTTGKHITKISAEQAQKENAKNGIKTEKVENKVQADAKYKNVFFKSTDKNGTKTFFKGAESTLSPQVVSAIKNDSANNVFAGAKAGAKKEDDKNKAPLLSFNTLFKGLGGLIVAGFAIKGLRQNKVVDELIVKSLKPFSKAYTKLTSEADHIMTKKDFDVIVGKLRETGFNELADKYVDVAKNHRLTSIANGVDNLLTVKSSKINEDIKILKELGGDSKEKALESLLANSSTSINEMTKVSQYLKTQGLDEIAGNYDKTIDALQACAKESKAKAPVSSNSSTGDLIKNVQAVIKDHTDNIHLGKKDKKVVKPIVDFIVGPFKFVWNILEAPYYWTQKIINGVTKQSVPAPEKVTSEISILGKSIQFIGKEATRKDFKPQAFKDFINDNVAKGFNVDTLSSVSNSDLANLSKTAVFAATLPFLMSDNYNMVMLKSNGKDKEGAELKSKERLVQEGSRFFYNTLFISLFNNAFTSQYHGSLLGMSWITAACTVIGEIINRKSVGVPVGTHSRDEILEMDKKMQNANSFTKGYYNFMSRLTGKKSLAEMQKAKQEAQKAKA